MAACDTPFMGLPALLSPDGVIIKPSLVAGVADLKIADLTLNASKSVTRYGVAW